MRVRRIPSSQEHRRGHRDVRTYVRNSPQVEVCTGMYVRTLPSGGTQVALGRPSGGTRGALAWLKRCSRGSMCEAIYLETLCVRRRVRSYVRTYVRGTRCGAPGPPVRPPRFNDFIFKFLTAQPRPYGVRCGHRPPSQVRLWRGVARPPLRPNPASQDRLRRGMARPPGAPVRPAKTVFYEASRGRFGGPARSAETVFGEARRGPAGCRARPAPDRLGRCLVSLLGGPTRSAEAVFGEMRRSVAGRPGACRKSMSRIRRSIDDGFIVFLCAGVPSVSGRHAADSTQLGFVVADGTVRTSVHSHGSIS